MSNTTMTVRGREKLCKAHAGEMALPCIKWIAFGTGGVDENRQPLPVTGEEVALREEQYRMELEHSFPIPTTCEYASILEKTDLPNTYISEMGFFDEEEELVMYATLLEKGKDEDMRFEFRTQEVF